MVPYLVTTGQAGSNVGTAGFAAFLRDALPPQHEGRPTVLLVLDRKPVETVKTAAQDASELPELEWSQLLETAIDDSPSDVKLLLTEAIHLAGEQLPQTATTIGRLKHLGACADATAAGASLYVLGPFVSDPDAQTTPRARLKESMRWRQNLDAWSSPDEDLDARLRPRYESEDDEGLARVRSARGPFGLDYSAFKLADLPVVGGLAELARLAHPLRIRGAAAATAQNRAATWIPGGGTIALALATPASRHETVTLRWSDGTVEDLSLAPGALEISFDVSGPGWKYVTVQLSGGQSAVLAVSTTPGAWAPIEVSLGIDPIVGAFLCGDQPQVVALAASSAILGQATIHIAPDANGERQEVATRFAGPKQQFTSWSRPGSPTASRDLTTPNPH